MVEPSTSFIEVQFPVSKLSKESFKERSAKNSQTLTGLGKWWGRKPLILVRAALIGLLMPASNNPHKDREIFLKILTMDEQGFLQRKYQKIPSQEIYLLLNDREKEKWFEPNAGTEKEPKYKKIFSQKQLQELQKTAFSRLSYDQKLSYCKRPEQIDGPTEETWREINAWLGTNAKTLVELVNQLGIRQLGHTPRVADAFCGGGSIPFEAARLGCEIYGSDLNPAAAFLSWAALNIVGNPKLFQEISEAQQIIYQKVNEQIIYWGIEHNEKGWRADSYLYCHEVQCPECSWWIPLAPKWVVSEQLNGIAVLIPDKDKKRFEIEIQSPVTQEQMDAAKKSGTVTDSYLYCPQCRLSTPISSLRKGGRTKSELRWWENQDIVPRPDDVFQERLYCIRWLEEFTDEEGKVKTRHHFCAPDINDFNREKKTFQLLQENFTDWQTKGYLPCEKIDPGDKTDEPIRTRGWTYWHHLFNPRQLLTLGCFLHNSHKYFVKHKEVLTGLLLGIARCCDYNSKLSRWHTRKVGDKSEQVFSNQALNTMFSYAVRPLESLKDSFFLHIAPETIPGAGTIEPKDARNITYQSDYWITDPPYADAINYHELSEFFLAWYATTLKQIFSNWYTESKRALAITGRDANFRKNMAACYQNLAQHMPNNGVQIVMFTNTDTSVWADLTIILWSSGLQVTAAWCIVTEIESVFRSGNYIQGTVLLVLRKQTSTETAFLDELYPQIVEEVKKQLDQMLALEDQEDPNFGDPDYQLAAYAAALRVLTRYRQIEDMDITRELNRKRSKAEESSPVEQIIISAVRIACDHLIPQRFDRLTWKKLKPEERFYLKGLDIESRGEERVGAYQELARGFGLREYKSLLHTAKANSARLHTASEFEKKELGKGIFGVSLLRQALFAIYETVRAQNAQSGKTWLRTELPDYWGQRQTLIEIFKYLETMGIKLEHWHQDSGAASLLRGALENDHA